MLAVKGRGSAVGIGKMCNGFNMQNVSFVNNILPDSAFDNIITMVIQTEIKSFHTGPQPFQPSVQRLALIIRMSRGNTKTHKTAIRSQEIVGFFVWFSWLT